MRTAKVRLGHAQLYPQIDAMFAVHKANNYYKKNNKDR